MPETHYLLGVRRLDLKDSKNSYGLFSFVQDQFHTGTVQLVSPLFESLEELAEKYLAENLGKHPYVSFYKPHQFPDFVNYLEGYYGPAVILDLKGDEENQIIKHISNKLIQKKNTPRKRHNPPI
ncbi:hypothetical protein HY837_06755 [archaeon]|nr:hypothetical protein [archaeon]